MFSIHSYPDEAGAAMLEMMQEFGLYEVSSFFQPSRRTQRVPPSATWRPTGYAASEEQGALTKKRKKKGKNKGKKQTPWGAVQHGCTQLDYAMASRRLGARSAPAPQGCRVLWGPSLEIEHLDGRHGLVEVVLRDGPKRDKSVLTL
jgi:hypothetical protein